jgi:hypothetical protein
MGKYGCHDYGGDKEPRVYFRRHLSIPAFPAFPLLSTPPPFVPLLHFYFSHLHVLAQPSYAKFIFYLGTPEENPRIEIGQFVTHIFFVFCRRIVKTVKYQIKKLKKKNKGEMSLASVWRPYKR